MRLKKIIKIGGVKMSEKKFDIYFCNRCFIGKTNLDKDFDFTSYYPKNYYGQDGKKFNFLIEFEIVFQFVNIPPNHL